MSETMHVTHDKGLEVVYVAFQDEYQGPVQTFPLREYLNVDVAPDGRIVGMQVLGITELNVEADWPPVGEG